DDDAHAVLVGFVTQFADAFEALFLHQLGDLLDQPGLVHLIRNLVDDDDLTAVLLGLHLGPRANEDAPAPGAIRLDDAGCAVDDAVGREIRTGDVARQLLDAEGGLVDERDRRGNHLAQVVGRNVRGHAHRDAGRAVDEQVRHPGRQHQWFALALVVVQAEIDGVLVDVRQQLVGELGHAYFGVAHGRGVVAVDRTEITLPVHQHVAQRKRLGHAHDGVVNRLVAVGMVFTDDVTDHAGGFLVSLVVAVAQLVHRVQHATMHWLEPIADIRQRAPDDDAHGVIEIALAHLVFDIDLNDFLRQLCHQPGFPEKKGALRRAPRGMRFLRHASWELYHGRARNDSI